MALKVIRALDFLPTRTVVLVTADRHVAAARATGSRRTIGRTGLVTRLIVPVSLHVGIAPPIDQTGFMRQQHPPGRRLLIERNQEHPAGLVIDRFGTQKLRVTERRIDHLVEPLTLADNISVVLFAPMYDARDHDLRV